MGQPTARLLTGDWANWVELGLIATLLPRKHLDCECPITVFGLRCVVGFADAGRVNSDKGQSGEVDGRRHEAPLL